MQAAAIPKAVTKITPKNKANNKRLPKSKRKSDPHEPQFHRAQIQARQNHRPAPTGWWQIGQQWFARVVMVTMPNMVFNHIHAV
ncbi:MAG: hypothetical protein WCT04_23825 [Planctomycetota bacterium]